MAESTPKITVAVPTMNGERYLRETLRSILSQENIAFDLIVSDDRSEDETRNLARSICGDRARIVANSERLGLAGNWNQCVALSRTPLVSIVHQDDLLRPGHLAFHTDAFAVNSDIGLVASASRVIDAGGNDIPETIVGRGGLGPVNHLFTPGEALGLMAVGNPFRCSAVSIRTEAHSQVHGFDPALRYVVDWDFWLRVASTWSIAWVASPTVDVRWHASSETHRFKTGTIDLEETEFVLDQLLKKLKSGSVSTRKIEETAKRAIARAYLNRSYEILKGGNGRVARNCLTKSFCLDPWILRTIVVDPKLACQMAAVWAAPNFSGHWFSKASSWARKGR